MVKSRFIKNVFGKAKGDILFSIINYLIFILLAFMMVYPFIIVIQDSFTVYKNAGGILIPEFSPDAYRYVFSKGEIFSSFLLTIVVVVSATALHLMVTVMGAYALSRKYLKGRNIIHFYILITFLFNGGMIPTYLLIKDLKLIDSIFVYIIPSATSSYNLIIAKNFFLSISDSLEESAKLDGAGHFRIFLSVYIPLSLPIISVLALWVAVGKWNDWFTGELYIRTPELLLIQNVLKQMLISESSVNDPSGQGKNELFALSENIKMATIIIATIPVLLIYPFVQKYFIQGVMLGSVKE